MEAARQSTAVWAYLVVSSEKQAETLDDQERWAQRTALANGWTITRTFKDTSTGKHGTRRLMQELLVELEALRRPQRPSRILMIRLDRTGRGMAVEPLMAVAKIYDLGITIHTRTDGDLPWGSVEDVIKPFFDLMAGAFENRHRRDKSTEKWQTWKAAGRKGTLRPYAIVTDEKGHDLALEPHAEFIREAFRMRVLGAGHMSIGNYLRENAPPMPMGKYAKKKGPEYKMRWPRGTVPQMLRNEAYRGVVVPEALWDEAQFVQNWARPRASKTFDWPLSGSLRCYCGYSMTGQASGGSCPRCTGGKRKHNHQRVRYYVCWEKTHVGAEPRRSRGPATPSAPRRRHVRADDLEAAFAQLLRWLANSPDSVARYVSEKRLSKRSRTALDQRVSSLQSRIAGADARKTQVWALLERGVIREDALQERLDQIVREVADAQKDLTALRAQQLEQEQIDATAESAYAMIQNAAEMWAEADVDDKRLVAQTISRYLGGITVERDGSLQPGRLREVRPA